MKFMPWQCYINLEQKTDLIPLNICQGFNVVDNITSTIRPGITTTHFYQVPMPVAAGRALPERGLSDWPHVAVDGSQSGTGAALGFSAPLSMHSKPALLPPCRGGHCKCCNRNISITFPFEQK